MRIPSLMVALAIVLAIAPCTGSGAGIKTQLSVLNSFSGPDGAEPNGGLVAGPNGTLYGTTFYGGTNPVCAGCGTVYQLTPPPPMSNDPWTETVIYSFGSNPDGAFPAAGLAIDAAGNLYGTTQYGGGACGASAYGCGTVFELSPPQGGQTNWVETVLYTFGGGTDGGLPAGATLLRDSQGNLYGASYYFGNQTLPACMPTPPPEQPNGCGLVYELSPPVGGAGGWTQTVLHTFTNSPDGAYPSAGVISDSAGNLYGVTAYGGTAGGEGTVYELSPPPGGQSAWTEQTLFSFNFTDGYFPFDPLTPQAGGAAAGLFGTTRFGGTLCAGYADGCGLVFSLNPPARGKKMWTERVLHRFVGGGRDGATPVAGVLLDAEGELLGTTAFGGGGPCAVQHFPKGCGVAYLLSPPGKPNGKWKETILHRFQNGSDGAFPDAGLIGDGQDNFFSTAPTSSGTDTSSLSGNDFQLSLHRGY
jgi:uncharacterized repeat protein (TIGR03803 family)